MPLDLWLRAAEAAQGSAVQYGDPLYKDARLRSRSGDVFLDARKLPLEKLLSINIEALDACLMWSGRPSTRLCFPSPRSLDDFLAELKQAAQNASHDRSLLNLKFAVDKAAAERSTFQAQVLHVLQMIQNDHSTAAEEARAIKEIQQYIARGDSVKVRKDGKEQYYSSKVLKEALQRFEQIQRKRNPSADIASSPGKRRLSAKTSRESEEAQAFNDDSPARVAAPAVASAKPVAGLRARLAARARADSAAPAATTVSPLQEQHGSSPPSAARQEQPGPSPPSAAREGTRIATPCRGRSSSASERSPVRPPHETEPPEVSPSEALRESREVCAPAAAATASPPQAAATASPPHASNPAVASSSTSSPEAPATSTSSTGASEAASRSLPAGTGGDARRSGISALRERMEQKLGKRSKPLEAAEPPTAKPAATAPAVAPAPAAPAPAAAPATAPAAVPGATSSTAAAPASFRRGDMAASMAELKARFAASCAQGSSTAAPPKEQAAPPEVQATPPSSRFQPPARTTFRRRSTAAPAEEQATPPEKQATPPRLRTQPPELPFAAPEPAPAARAHSETVRKKCPKAKAEKAAPREGNAKDPLEAFTAKLKARVKAPVDTTKTPPSQETAESSLPCKRKASSPPEPTSAARRRRLSVHSASTTRNSPPEPGSAGRRRMSVHPVSTMRAPGTPGRAKEKTPSRITSPGQPRSASRRASASGMPPSEAAASSSSKGSSSAVASVKELKALLQKSCVDCSECVEKADLKTLWDRFETFRSRPLRELQASCTANGGSAFASVDECARFLVAPKSSQAPGNRPAAAAAAAAAAAGAGGSTAAAFSAAAPDSPPKRAMSAQSDLDVPKEAGGARVEVERILSIRKEAFPGSSDWGFAVLGNPVDMASLQRAYRTLMKKVHPDKVGQSPRVVQAADLLREAKELCEKELNQKEPPERPRNVRSTLICSDPGHRKIKLDWTAPDEGHEDLKPIRRYLVAVVDPAYGRALTVAVLEPDYNEELRRFVSVEDLSSYVLAEEELQKMPSLFQQSFLLAQVAAANEAGQSDWAPVRVCLMGQSSRRKTVTGPSHGVGGLSAGAGGSSASRGTMNFGGSAGSAPPQRKGSDESAVDDAAAARMFGKQIGGRKGAALRTWLEKQRKGPITAWLKSKGWPNTGTKEDLIERVIFVAEGSGRGR